MPQTAVQALVGGLLAAVDRAASAPQASVLKCAQRLALGAITDLAGRTPHAAATSHGCLIGSGVGWFSRATHSEQTHAFW